jgi:hypothetical protein
VPRNPPKHRFRKEIPALIPVRARLLLLAFAVSACIVTPALAARISGIGLIDYRKKTFKVGDWVRYKVEVSNSNGMEAENYQELRIVGEETFRGEPCTWVETWFGKDSTSAAYDLTLISNSVFKDPQSDVRFSIYTRLIMLDTDDQGRPEMTEVRRADNSKEMPDLTPYRGKVDTLGFQTFKTPKGDIEARIVSLERKLKNPRDTPDSTINKITHVVRKSYLSRKVPITSLVGEDETEDWLIQSYKLGEVSSTAPEVPISSEERKVTVIDWGSGAKSTLLAQWREKKAEMKLPALRD